MAVTFPDEIHPKKGLRLQLKLDYRAVQYLAYFHIIETYPNCKICPLNITFENRDELEKFLNMRGIVYDEVHVTDGFWKNWEKITIVDTLKIYEVEESVSKYLLNYKYYSVNEVAEILSFSRPSVYKFVNDHKLKAIRIHGQLRINHLDLIAFINKDRQQ